METKTEKNKFAEFWQYIEKHKPSIENALRENLPVAPTHIETQFNEALEYALVSGGNRFRSILTMLGAELVEGKAVDVLPSAVAVEFIHTSSLIFNDLPCMDNSAKLREKESLPEKYGEGLAVLVGLGFLNASYPLVFVNHSGMPERAMLAHAEIVECVGAAGLVGGQTVKNVDGFENQNYETDSIKNLKTSALLRLALRLGAILSGANYIELASLSRFAELLGDAYQMSDNLMTKETTNLDLNSTINEAKRILVENFPSNEARSCMIQFTEYLAERKV